MTRRKKRSSVFDVTPIKLPKNILSVPSLYPTEPKKDTRRSFTQTQKNEILYQQDNKCASSLCHHKKLDPRATEFDHKKPWASGGANYKEKWKGIMCGMPQNYNS